MAITYKRSLIDTSPYNQIISSNLNGIWTWFTDPRTVYINGCIYICYLSTNDVIISKIDNNKVVTSFTLKSDLETDDHANPSILIRPDGKIQVFYCAHNGASMFYRISTNAEDISAWGSEQTLGTNLAGINGYSYSNPYYLSAENKYYLFWRGASWETAFSTSTNGTTWENASVLFSNGSERPYTRYYSDGIDTIHIAVTDGHPNSVALNNVYYFKYTNGNFYKADGSLIGTIAEAPFAPSDGDKVHDAVSTNISGWIWDIVADSTGKPVMVYSTFPTTRNHVYKYAKWSGSAWVINEVLSAGDYLYSAEPYYSGGICLDQSDSNIIYLSKQTQQGYDISKLITADNGANWEHSQITKFSSNKNLRPVSIRGYNSPSVLWFNGRYTTFINYDTKLLSFIS